MTTGKMAGGRGWLLAPRVALELHVNSLGVLHLQMDALALAIVVVRFTFHVTSAWEPLVSSHSIENVWRGWPLDGIHPSLAA